MREPINQRFARRYPEAAALAEGLGIGVRYVKRTWRTDPGDRQLTGYQYRDGEWLTEAERDAIPLEMLQRIQEAREARGAKTPYERAAHMLASLRGSGPRHGMITECRMPCLDSASHWSPFGRHEITLLLVDANGTIKLETGRTESWDECMVAAENMIKPLAGGPKS